MMEIWKTAAEWALEGLPGLPEGERGMRKRATDNAWASRPREKTKGGGKEYPLSALPREAQDAFELRQIGEISKKTYEKHAPVQPMTATEREAAAVKYFRLKDKAQQRAAAKLTILQVFRALTGKSFKERSRDFAVRYNAQTLDLPVEIYTVIPDLAARTLGVWLRRQTEQGLPGLAGQYGNRKGKGALAAGSFMSRTLRAVLFDTPHVSSNYMREVLKVRFPDQKIPEVRSIQLWRKQYIAKNKQFYLFMTNPDAWKNQHMSASGKADANIKRLNQRWEMDGTPTDIMLSDGKRYNITGCIDVYSRRPKVHLTKSASTEAVCTLYRKCVLDWGKPETLGHDNGTEYVSARFQAALESTNVEAHRAEKFSPEQKPFIERFFGTLSHGMYEALHGFIGHNVNDRKAIESRRSFAQRLTKKGEEKAYIELRLTPEEFQSWLDDWINNVYMHNKHRGLGGKTPYQMVSEWIGPVSRVEDERALDILLSPLASKGGARKVQKKGIEMPLGFFDAPELGPIAGQSVLVRLDETDVGRVYVFDEDNVFVCVAVCTEVAGTATLQEVAVVKKRMQSDANAQGRKAEKKAIAEIKPRAALEEIRKSRAKEAAKIVRLPIENTRTFSNDALNEAGKASRAGEMPHVAALTPEQEEIQGLLQRHYERENAPKPAEIIPMREASAVINFKRALTILRAQEAGETVSDEDARWFTAHSNSSAFKSNMRLYKAYGEQALLNALG